MRDGCVLSIVTRFTPKFEPCHKIHDKGTLGSKDFFWKKDPIIGNITQIDMINSINKVGGSYGVGNDPLEFYPDFFQRFIQNIGNQELPGITIKMSGGKLRVPLMLISCGEGETIDYAEANVLKRLEGWPEALSRVALFPLRVLLAPKYEIKKSITVKHKEYKLFAIMWGWLDNNHTWTYVKSKKDGCWYCYNSLGKSPAYKVSENSIELTPKSREGKNMQPYICFYELDESSKLSLRLVELKKSLQALKAKLSSLQEKLAALDAKLGH